MKVAVIGAGIARCRHLIQQNLPAGQLKTPADTASYLLATIRAVSEAETGLLGRVDVFCLDFVRTGGALIAKRGAQFSHSK
ncbi:MAG: hypothetical protein B7X50_08630 [Alishewanella sp. 34-51-39]|nr:MAG: hypothetical protein B7X50_08630 [Alishewanella sp. 34-51-39]